MKCNYVQNVFYYIFITMYIILFRFSNTFTDIFVKAYFCRFCTFYDLRIKICHCNAYILPVNYCMIETNLFYL